MTSLTTRSSPVAPRLLLATRNPGKVREYRALMAELPFTITSLAEQQITHDAAETGDTFEGNARLKARTYAQLSGLWAWADDSGLEVDVLDGAPGVYSARYAGANATDAANNAKLIAALQPYAQPDRTARFRCVVAIAAPDGAIYTCTDSIEGVIIDDARGAHGFGYDPHFYLPERGQTLAELPPHEKNRISHRGKAARAARRLLFRLYDAGRVFP